MSILLIIVKNTVIIYVTIRFIFKGYVLIVKILKNTNFMFYVMFRIQPIFVGIQFPIFVKSEFVFKRINVS